MPGSMAPAAMAAVPASMTASIAGLRRHRDALERSLAHRRLDDLARRDAELGVEQLGPRGVLRLGRGVLAGQSVEPDQQRLVVLVERAHRGRAYGEPARPVERAPGQQPHRRLVQDALGCGRDSSSFGEQPRLEGRRAADHDAVEQLGVEADHLDGVGPGRVGEHRDVDDGVFREPQHDGVAVERGAVAEAAPDLGQAPPQRAQRVVRLAEQQPRQLAPGRGCLAQQQVREQRPALPAAQAVRRPVRPLDARSAEEPDAQRHQPLPISSAEQPWSAGEQVGSPRSTGRGTAAGRLPVARSTNSAVARHGSSTGGRPPSRRRSWNA